MCQHGLLTVATVQSRTLVMDDTKITVSLDGCPDPFALFSSTDAVSKPRGFPKFANNLGPVRVTIIQLIRRGISSSCD